MAAAPRAAPTALVRSTVRSRAAGLRSSPLLASLACLACGPYEPAPETSGRAPETTRSDSAGVEIVSVGPDTLLLPVEETLRLGTIDGGGPEQFVRIGAVALGPEGHIYVGDGGTSTARVFDARGRFVRELAGRGQGPSEVIMVNDLLLSGDTVVVVDWQANGKVVRFDGDGTFLDSNPLLRPDMTSVVPAHAGSGGWLATVIRVQPPPPLAPGEGWTNTVVVHEVDYEAGGVLGAERYRVAGATMYATGGTSEGSMDWGLFRPRFATGFDSGGRMYLTDPAAYRIDVFDGSGLRRSVRREAGRRPLTDADVEALRDAVVDVIDTAAMWPGADRAEQRRGILERIDRQARLPRPDVASPLGELLVSPDGGFWVEVRGGASPVAIEVEQMFAGFAKVPAEETTWDLFAPSGEYRGTAVLPRRFRAEAVSGTTVVGVLADDLDIEYVVRFEVRPHT